MNLFIIISTHQQTAGAWPVRGWFVKPAADCKATTSHLIEVTYRGYDSVAGTNPTLQDDKMATERW